MAGSKRARQLARAKYERQQQRREAAASRRRIVNRVVGTLVVVALVGGGVTWWALSSRGGVQPTPSPTDSPTASPTPEPTDSPTASPTPEPSPIVDGCVTASTPRPDDMSWPEAPADSLKPNTNYTITLDTNCGAITIATMPVKAPKTTNSMVFLTNQKYFDLTRCHRLTTAGIYVLQCGDPAGNGTGGPGYTVPDENLPADEANNYPAGTVAMANAGRGTAGSQFFIVYDDTTLPPDYTIWGTVTSGLDIVKAIAAAGVEGGGSDGAPAQPVSINAATVTEKPTA